MASYMSDFVSSDNDYVFTKDGRLYIKRLLEMNPNFSVLKILFVMYLCHVHISVSIDSC